MSALAARERRQPVRIAGRLKSGRGWSDVVIGNVSSRGMMGVCATPPARGDYVEVRCGGYVIVARIAWTSANLFGARAQDVIDFDQLLASSRGRASGSPEQRELSRAPAHAPRRPSVEERAAESARWGHKFDFISLGVAGIALAALVGGAAYDAMALPADKVSRALAAGRAR